MNPAALNLSALPSPCAQTTAGVDGPDQITYQSYNADNSAGATATGWGTSYSRNAVNNGYNSDGTLGSQADGKGNITCYAYDGFGRLTSKSFATPSNGGACNASDYESYAYDANANLTSRRQRDGTTLTYGYDVLNRLTTDSNNVYAYDLQGRLATSSRPSFASTFNHDALGRTTQDYDSYYGAVYSSYDAAGNRTQLKWQDGLYVNYGHDLLGRVTTIGENGATSGVGLLASYSYDSFGRLQSIMYAGAANTLSQGFLYGSDSRPCISGYTLADSSKNMQSWVTYNAAGEIKVRYLTNDLYDWAGSASADQGYTINGLNQATTGGSTTFTYDARGGLSSDGTYTYGYDSAHDQLNSVSGGGLSVSLGYDSLHRLTQVQGSATTRFIYDGSTLSEEMDTSGDVLARYVPGPDGTPLLWYNGSGTSDRRWLLKDQQGSVIAVANSSGGTLAINTYDAYGLPGGSNLGRIQYTGQSWISEDGLYDYRARTYSPTLGRFLQTDPIGYGDGMNWYAYVHGDPVNGTDPTGLDCEASGYIDGYGATSGGSGGGCPSVGGGGFGGGGPSVAAAGVNFVQNIQKMWQMPQGKMPASNNCTMARAQLGADADRLATAAKALEVGGVAAIAGGTFGIETVVGALAIDSGIFALQVAGVANSAAAGLRSYANTGSVAGGILVGAGSLAANQALASIAGLTPSVTNLQAQVLSSLLGQNLANFQAQVQRSLRIANGGC